MLFSYGRVVTGNNFYDRSKMQKELKKMVRSGQSFMLKAPRRYGKTSIIKQILQSEGEVYFYVDFRKIPRLEIFNKKLMEYIYSLMGVTGALKQLKENVITFLSTYRTRVTVDVAIFEASVELYASSQTEEDKFVNILELLGRIGESKKQHLNIVFDEFQDIQKLSKEIDVAEHLRAEIQHHENVCYIFAGSNMTMMRELFEKKSSPFYNFGRKIALKPFDEIELSHEVLEAFKSRGVVFENETILRELIQVCDGHPANTMLVLQMIEYKMQDEEIQLVTAQIIHECYEDAKVEMNDLVMEYLKEIRVKEHLHDVIFREANAHKHILEASSLQQKRKVLVDMGHLEIIERGKYKIVDNFLRDELKEEASFTL